MEQEINNMLSQTKKSLEHQYNTRLEFKPKEIAIVLVLSVAGIALLSVVTISTLPTLILAGSGIAAAYLLFVLNFVLNPEEREMIRSCLPEVCQKRIPSWLL